MWQMLLAGEDPLAELARFRRRSARAIFSGSAAEAEFLEFWTSRTNHWTWNPSTR